MPENDKRVTKCVKDYFTKNAKLQSCIIVDRANIIRKLKEAYL